MTGHALPVFVARDLVFRYPGATEPALDSVNLAVERGKVFAVVGPNGSGKSTLLKVLLGLVHPTSGAVEFEGRAPRAWKRAELARHVGVVPQLEAAAFPVTVRETVAMGRYPHLGLWQREGPTDRRAIARALERCDVTHLARRSISNLSGGEQQRTRVARALAQEPSTLVLDEPTASLDVHYEMSIFELLASLSRLDGATVLLVTHSLNLAARYADRLLLLDHGRAVREGAPDEVLDQATLEAVYGWPLRIRRYEGPGPDTGAPQVTLLRPPSDQPDGSRA
jgi:iron complex transport system ATP-binding protein